MNQLLSLERCLLNIIKNVGMQVYPLIGASDKKAIDETATMCFDELLNWGAENGVTVHAISIEGERDGILVSPLQTMQPWQKAALAAAIDPIDGTTPCAAGGSRCVSAAAVSLSPQVRYLAIPDELSCFCFASNTDPAFAADARFALPPDCSTQNRIATLHRAESKELWEFLLSKPLEPKQLGEKSFYLPNMITDEIFFAGDTSIPLFYECDHFLGRVGISEARMESRLWRFWRGIIVSAKRLKEQPVAYLQQRMKAAYNPSSYRVNDFFTAEEVSRLKLYGWDDVDILRLHTPQTFAPVYDLILIGSITGTKDAVLDEHSQKNFHAIRRDPDTGMGEMEVFVQSAQGKREIKKICLELSGAK